MRDRQKIIVGISLAVAVGVIVYLTLKTKETKTIKKLERLDRIAEEGYETAGDILYPLKASPLTKIRSRYKARRKGRFTA